MEEFGFRILICSLWISGFILLLLLGKRLLKKRLSPRMQYCTWFLLLFLLAVPLLPDPSPQPGGSVRTTAQHTAAGPETIPAEALDSTVRIPAFAVSVSQKIPAFLHPLIAGIWLAGIAVSLAADAWNRIRLHRLKASAVPVQNRRVTRIFLECRQTLGIRRRIGLLSTPCLRSPASFGVLRPQILIPGSLAEAFNDDEIRFILLHELEHYKCRDALVSHLMNAARILYWFHPLVRLALGHMRLEREIACDASVLLLLPETEHYGYGNTLLKFARREPDIASIVPGLGGSRRQIEKRIQGIASFGGIPVLPAGKKAALFLLGLAVTALCCSPLSTHAFAAGSADYLSRTASDAMAGETTGAGNPDSGNGPPGGSTDSKATELESYFSGQKGCFVLYDPASSSWDIYRQDLARERISPDSTYKIYCALLGLDKGVITPRQNTMAWDGTEYSIDQWNQDQNLELAMQNSTNWYFQAIDRELGQDRLESFFTEIGYGNQDLSGGVGQCWLESSLKISPLEQVKLLQAFREGSLPVSPEAQAAVKDAMHLASTERGTLYGKTGTGLVDGRTVNGWFVGFVESRQGTYYFAANLRDGEGSAASEITIRILKDRGLL